MAVSDSGGVFETVLRMRDEATSVARKFADTVKESLGEAKTATDSAGKKTEELAETSVVAYGKVAAAVAAATVAVTAFAVKALKTGIDQADQAQETAKRIGISVEAYTQLGFVAELAGVKQEQLAGALTLFAKNSGKAVDGAKGLAATFERLGIDTEAFARLSPEEKLFAVADGLARLPEGFERARAAQEIFGRSGATMVNVLEGGSQQLRAMMAEADALGVTITTRTGRDADRFNDSLTRMSANLGKVRTEITAETVGAFASLSESFQVTLRDSGAIELAAKGLTVVLKTLAFAANIVGDIFGFVGRILGGIAATVVALIKGEFRDAGRISQELTKDLIENARRSQEAYEKLLGLNQERDRAQGKPGFKKSSFGAEEDGSGFQRVNSLEGRGSFTYSDVLPGAELITAAREQGQAEEIASLEEHHTVVEEKTRAHTLRLADYDRSARAIRFQMGQRYDKLGLDASAFFFGQLGALMQTKSRALFEVGKAGAIAETIIQTYRAAQGAYAALASIPYVGPALGAAAAAAAIAVGFARVQAIRSTSYGGASGSPVLSSGGLSGPVVSAGTPQAVVPPASLQGVAAEKERVVNVFLSGEGSPTQSYIRDVLVPGLNEALGDGAVINVRAA